MLLTLEADRDRWPIRCDPDTAPRTLAALAEILPLEVRFQTPKIAGSHIYWQAPLLCDLETGADIMGLAPGSFLYWPDRQFLEILFAPLQQETASVTLLGRLADPAHVAVVAEFGRRLRETTGNRILTGRLTLADGVTAEVSDGPADADGALADLRRARRAAWTAPPPELSGLLADRGILHPAGPLFFAEGEARGLHELLWCLRREGDASVLRIAAGTAIDKAAARLAGFCHLASVGAELRRASALLHDPAADARTVLDETILYCGAVSAWLDVSIPWNAVNEAVRATLKEEADS